MKKYRIHRTYVAPSKIPDERAGNGLFAGAHIPKGGYIGEYGGDVLARGREEALELRDSGKDGWIKRLGSIMHGDYINGPVNEAFPVSYYMKH